MKKDHIFYSWISIWGIASLMILFTTNAVGDNADGVMHYMFARYAHLHPDNFLDPWAKTCFTLVAWPFAQFGLKGVMFLNILCAGGSMWLVYQISKKLEIKYSWISFVFLSLSTYYFTLMFSGLTEHTFSFVLILSIYLIIKNKWIIGTLVLSTLPFFRQEGYIILASLIPLYIYYRKVKLLPLFATTFVLVGLAGAFRFNDLMWIIHSNPYSNKSSYGSGTWYDFLVHLYYNNGLINLIFFIVGILFMGVSLIKKRTYIVLTIFLGVFLPFLAFFASHALFWYFGIFHSMGLQRVLNGVAPLFSIIAALGFSSIINMLPLGAIQKIVTGIAVATIIIYPFTPSPSSFHLEKAFISKPIELKIKEATYLVKTNFPNKMVYAEHPLVPFFLDLDPFDRSVYEKIYMLNDSTLQPGGILIWENSFANVQAGMSEEVANKKPQLLKLKEFTTSDNQGKIILFQIRANKP